MHTIIMPYLDCPEFTEVAIQDCLKQTIGQVRLLLIDNGSQEPGRQLGEDSVRAFHLPPTQEVLLWHHDPPFPALSTVWNRALQFVWECGEDRAWVVNNDARFHRDTYKILTEVQEKTDGWFVTGVSVREPQFDPDLDIRAHLGTVTESRKDGVRPEGYSYGGPDFSCYLITKECHERYPFDKGFIPAYHEDCDLHRRLMLDGHGHRIFGVNVPFLHYGSGTINRTAEARAAFSSRFEQCKAYYIRKWGGGVGHETYRRPFDEASKEEGITNPELQHGVVV